jgi:hypothetical protein
MQLLIQKQFVEQLSKSAIDVYKLYSLISTIDLALSFAKVVSRFKVKWTRPFFLDVPGADPKDFLEINKPFLHIIKGINPLMLLLPNFTGKNIVKVIIKL